MASPKRVCGSGLSEREEKRKPSRVDRKREGWNNYVSAHRLFDLLKVQEKGVSPSDCQYMQCYTL